MSEPRGASRPVEAASTAADALGDGTDGALLFAGVVHYARCWECMTMQCPGGQHRWACQEDIDHAVEIGRPETAEGRCSCHCYDEPERVEEPPDLDVVTVSIDGPPCHLCGAPGACGYDDEGRPYIHASWDEDETDVVA